MRYLLPEKKLSLQKADGDGDYGGGCYIYLKKKIPLISTCRTLDCGQKGHKWHHFLRVCKLKMLLCSLGCLCTRLPLILFPPGFKICWE